MPARRLLVLAVSAAALAVALTIAPAAPAAAAARTAQAAAGPGTGLVTAAEQRWLAAVGQLASNVLTASRNPNASASSLAAARALLANTQALFDAAVGYGVYSGCSTSVGAAGKPSARLSGLGASVGAACNSLVHAAGLFLRGVHERKAKLLADADQEATRGLRRMAAVATAVAAFRKAHP